VVTAASDAGPTLSLGPDDQWSVVEGSEHMNYYHLKDEDGRRVFHASYFAHVPTVTLGRKLPEPDQHDHHLSWDWRVHKFPEGSDERNDDTQDSALAVYATFGTALHRTSIKYIWSATLPKGTVIGPSSHIFYDIVTVVLEGPGGTDQWKHENIDVAQDWARFFADKGQTAADVPPFIGVGLLTDGDQTNSRPSADYASFQVSP
jgi:hypothetical protein